MSKQARAVLQDEGRAVDLYFGKNKAQMRMMTLKHAFALSANATICEHVALHGWVHKGIEPDGRFLDAQALVQGRVVQLRNCKRSRHCSPKSRKTRRLGDSSSPADSKQPSDTPGKLLRKEEMAMLTQRSVSDQLN
ncbi:unnamed protein product [Symbiodinium sp. CCMP2592]|nr:unnamed protein product [Symbiodinium sp. CCMP2592]